MKMKVLKGKVIAIKSYIKSTVSAILNNLTLQLKKLGRKNELKSNSAGGRK